MTPNSQAPFRHKTSAVADAEIVRPPRMIHVVDRADPQYPRGLCGRAIGRVLPSEEARARPIDCLVCAELNKTHDWHGPWKP